jgi:hypothetical protein
MDLNIEIPIKDHPDALVLKKEPFLTDALNKDLLRYKMHN